MSHNTCHQGAQNELISSIWLMQLGYEVFRNVSGGGPGDLVIWNPITDEKHIIDVKGVGTKWARHSMPLAKSRTHPNANVLFLVVRDGVVDGFWRAKQDGSRGTERFWPLAIAEPAVQP